jgi:hypothetical protein
MKKLIMILTTAAAFGIFSCGDANRSSQQNDNMNNNDNTELSEPDTADASTNDEMNNSRMQGDTTSTGDRDRDNRLNSDSLQKR